MVILRFSGENAVNLLQYLTMAEITMYQKEYQRLESVVVSAQQMAEIEERILARGMPVAALMEKAALLSAEKIKQLYPPCQVGVLAGPGHNGGDALVIARELYLEGYSVLVYCPQTQMKELTSLHAQYAKSLGIPFFGEIEPLQHCDLIVDGLFGVGLTRSLEDDLAASIEQVNQWDKAVVSIDLPSGIHTDTGQTLGIALQATHTLCLGLWKRAFFQDQALAALGKAQRIDFGFPPQDVWAVLSYPPPIQQITPSIARSFFPLPRPVLTHKYQQGHLLLICGSSRYAGGAILTGLGARASGVGMLSIAVPASLKPLLVSYLPEALIIDCPETPQGAIASLPPLAADFSAYSVIACGPGLTQEGERVVRDVLYAPCPLVLDADGLNCLASQGLAYLSHRPNVTVLTPHLGEFRRLFPQIQNPQSDRLQSAQLAAHQSQSVVLLKGARTVIASPDGTTWLVPESTPALARGGSGDVLTGLMGGLLAQNPTNTAAVVATSAWWHAQAGILAASERSQLGVDGLTLASYMIEICNKLFPKSPTMAQSSW